MNEVGSTFPLLRLPKRAMLKTLRLMTLLQIFGISILSKRSKDVVESLKLTPESLRIRVDEFFMVTLDVANYAMLTFQLYHVWENQPLQELGTPSDSHFSHDQNWSTWTNPMSVKQLLDHIHFVFHSSGASLIFYEHCERFSLQSIYENVKHIKNVCLKTENQEHNRRILSLFRPASLTLSEQALVKFRVPRDILVQNFDVLDVENGQISLDDLLLTNARCLYSECRTLSMRTLNKFLKLWIKDSNPRLEFLFLDFRGHVQFEELFDGLKYQNAPNGVRLHKTASNTDLVEIQDGQDIWRVDGTKATISAGGWEDCAWFGLYVWHDHCVVN